MRGNTKTPLGFLLIALGILWGGAVQAQDPALESARASSDAALEEVVVTGSRLTSANLLSASPIIDIDSEDIAARGTVRMEDMLGTIPSVFLSQSSAFQNGSTGTATVSLRLLGSLRTLVLVNSRRLPAGSPIQGGAGADINQIPAALIRKVEVLTGGTSAVYGSDAMAGVVNFLIKDDFEGVQLEYQFSGYQHDNDNVKFQELLRDRDFFTPSGSVVDGEIDNLSLVAGGNFEGGRGNVTAYATYRNIRPVKQNQRDYSACALNKALAACGGSQTIPTGNFYIGPVETRALNLPAVDLHVVGSDFVERPSDLFYNYQGTSFFQRPDERISLGALAHYEINEYAEAYTELMFTDDSSLAQIGPSGLFFDVDHIRCDNPLLSAQQVEICETYDTRSATGNDGPDDGIAPFFIGRRNVEGGARQYDLRHTSYRGVFGARGSLFDDWKYDIFYQYAEVSMESVYRNDLSKTNLARAVDVVLTEPEDGSPGVPVCRVALEGDDLPPPADPNCVPWNIYQSGGVTPEALAYIQLPLFALGNTKQQVLSAYVSRDLGEYGVKMPWSSKGIELVLGLEERLEKMTYDPDQGYRSGDGAGQGGAQKEVRGSVEVSEFFLEASIPMLEGSPLAEYWTLHASYRNSDYDYNVRADTFGLRSDWQINSNFRVRSSIQSALRGPNVRELFVPATFNLFDMDTDPCGGGIDENDMTGEGENKRTLEECMRSGVTAAQFGSIANSAADQYNFLDGGNPDLEPEDGNTLSVGLIYTPSFLDGFSLSADYYLIEIEGGISEINPEFILNQCLDGNLELCSKVKRSANGDLWRGSDVNTSGHIVSLQDNLAKEEVSGLDIVMDYTQLFDELGITGWGSLEINNVLSYIHRWEQQEIEEAAALACHGKWNSTCGSPTPRLRNQLQLHWDLPDGVVPGAPRMTMAWRYISAVDDLGAADNTLGARNYFDVSGSIEVAEYLRLRAGANNVFDREPPIAGDAAGPSNFGEGNVFGGVYDSLGRYFFLSLSLNY